MMRRMEATVPFKKKSLKINVFFCCFLLSFLFVATGIGAEETDFDQWLLELRAEARSSGISENTLDRALDGIKPNELVLALDRKQPEFSLSFADYLTRMVPPSRIRRGRQKWREHAGLLQKVSAEYGVPAHYLLAFWGIETDYGRVTGGYPVVVSLATLAHDPRRSDFFRRELLDALHLIDEGRIDLEQMKGSWAGAMGYMQFLPSVIRRYGLDADGDGKLSIWQAGEDLLYSAANYLAASGWRRGERWGREIRLPSETVNKDLTGLEVQKRVSFWRQLGVRKLNDTALPAAQIPASLIMPDEESKRAFLVYNNFRTIMKWNRSTYYALAVGILADAIVR